MIKPEQVPLAVWIALRDHVRERPYGYDYTKAIAAALNAWPGMRKDWTSAFADEVALILPLMEKTDDQA